YLNIFGKPNYMLEKALGDMIHQGDIFRYQRKSQKMINERKGMFPQLLNTYFKNKITFNTPASGLAFWIQVNDPLSLTQLQKTEREKGLLIPSICQYQNRTLTALRLSFARLHQQDMEETMKLLKESYQEVIQ